MSSSGEGSSNPVSSCAPCLSAYMSAAGSSIPVSAATRASTSSRVAAPSRPASSAGGSGSAAASSKMRVRMVYGSATVGDPQVARSSRSFERARTILKPPRVAPGELMGNEPAAAQARDHVLAAEHLLQGLPAAAGGEHLARLSRDELVEYGPLALAWAEDAPEALDVLAARGAAGEDDRDPRVGDVHTLVQDVGGDHGAVAALA